MSSLIFPGKGTESADIPRRGPLFEGWCCGLCVASLRGNKNATHFRIMKIDCILMSIIHLAQPAAWKVVTWRIRCQEYEIEDSQISWTFYNFPAWIPGVSTLSLRVQKLSSIYLNQDLKDLQLHHWGITSASRLLQRHKIQMRRDFLLDRTFIYIHHFP